MKGEPKMACKNLFKMINVHYRLSDAERQTLIQLLEKCRAEDISLEQLADYAAGIAEEERQFANGTWEP
jgi:hypothetical protein